MKTPTVTVKSIRREADGWHVCFDYGTPTDISNAHTQYHWGRYPDPRGAGPAPRPFYIGQKVSVEAI